VRVRAGRTVALGSGINGCVTDGTTAGVNVCVAVGDAVKVEVSVCVCEAVGVNESTVSEGVGSGNSG
jgi:hypothetical protein